MTATEPSVKEAAAFTWKLIADFRSHCKTPDEPGFPLAVALERVTDTGCEREAALQALCDAASARLRASRPPVQDRTAFAPVGPCVEFVGEPALLDAAERYREEAIRLQMTRYGLTEAGWKNRADWLAWAEDARVTILWLQELKAECEK